MLYYCESVAPSRGDIYASFHHKAPQELSRRYSEQDMDICLLASSKGIFSTEIMGQESLNYL